MGSSCSKGTETVSQKQQPTQKTDQQKPAIKPAVIGPEKADNKPDPNKNTDATTADQKKETNDDITDSDVPDLHVAMGSAPCRASMMACKLAGVKVNLKIYDLFKGEHMTEAFLKINPNHTVPTLCDNGFVVPDSRPLVTYLMTKYARNHTAYPCEDLQKKVRIDQLLYYDMEVLYAKVGKVVYPHIFGKPSSPDAEGDLKKVLDVADVRLGVKDFATGDNVTIADCFMAASVSFLELIDFDISGWPNLQGWMTRMKQQPWFDECNKGLYEWKEHIKAKQEQSE